MKKVLSLSRNRPLNSKFKNNKVACPAKLQRSGGFTLLEILLVVGIISILAGIVIVAINPSKQLATVRNTERRSDIKQIDSAVTQYYIDNFHFPTSITTSLTEICDTGSVASTTTAVDGTACGSLVNLSSLVPNYIVAIPKDPQGAIAFLDKLITPAYAAVGGTGYQIMKSSSNKIITKAAKAELDAFIAIGTTTAATSTPEAEPETYTVTYNGNSNTGGTAPASQTKTEDVTLVLRTNSGSLVKTSYVFAGWNTLANGSGTTYAVGANFTTNATTTLYAKWTANPTYTVTFDANGGTGSMSTQSISEGSSANLTANSFTRTDYTFAGWATSAGGAVAYADQASYTMGGAGVILYAKWTAITHTVTFNANGGSGSMSAQTINQGSSANLTANSFTRANYTFAGWNTVAGGSGTSYANSASYTMGSSNVTLYAQWTAVPTYTVTYNGNGNTGGTVPTDTNTYVNGTTVTVASNTGTLVKTGHTFTGWNTLANGTGTDRATSTTFAMGGANVTLYAKWTVAGCGGPTVAACWSPAVSDKAWGPTGVITGVQGNTDGAANTTDLVAIAGNNYPAAEYCDGLDQGGHQDWYLPAKQQLIDGLTNQFVTPGGTVTGFVVGTGYWSSTERSDGPGNDARYAGYYYGAVNSYSNSKDGINLQTRCLR